MSMNKLTINKDISAINTKSIIKDIIKEDKLNIREDKV